MCRLRPGRRGAGLPHRAIAAGKRASLARRRQPCWRCRGRLRTGGRGEGRPSPFGRQLLLRSRPAQPRRHQPERRRNEQQRRGDRAGQRGWRTIHGSIRAAAIRSRTRALRLQADSSMARIVRGLGSRLGKRCRRSARLAVAARKTTQPGPSADQRICAFPDPIDFIAGSDDIGRSAHARAFRMHRTPTGQG